MNAKIGFDALHYQTSELIFDERNMKYHGHIHVSKGDPHNYMDAYLKLTSSTTGRVKKFVPISYERIYSIAHEASLNVVYNDMENDIRGLKVDLTFIFM